MYLKELEIFGFKSFPGKTNLKFESGITAIVGPNGCGKSNIFDSIKWVLGEQSPKSLRGSKMEDIIFNGTESYPPLNYAEVAITFSNEDRYLPIDYKEVNIARRLYRSGESQYFINKNMVRLKDVQELFMGTGIGEATYSFIEQGKIEIFLSYKPEDKRLIFDEASGIIKYKERKKETLRRLEETEENLLRLEDILSEVRRQIQYLERQVEKAKKYKEIQAQLLEVEKKIATLQSLELEEKINKLLDELNIFTEKEQEKTNQLKELNDRWQVLYSQLKSLRVRLAELAETVASLGAQIEGANNYITVNYQRIKELSQRNVNLEHSKTNLIQRLKLQEQKHQTETKHLEALEEKVKNLDQEIKKLEVEKDELGKKIEEAKKKTNALKTKILDLESKKVQSHNTLIEIQAQLSSLANRKKRLLLDKAKLETLLAENKENFKAEEAAFLKAKANLENLEDEKNSLVHKEKSLVSLIEETKTKLVDKEKELLELKASYEFLKDLHIKYETFSLKKKITVIFDEEPKNINKLVASLQDVEFKKEGNFYKAQIEAKVVSFEEKQLEERIDLVQEEIKSIKIKLQDLEQEKIKLTESLSAENVQIEEKRKQMQEKLQEKDVLKREVDRLEEEFQLLEEEIKATIEDMADSEKKQTEVSQELSVYEEDLNKANQDLWRCQEIMSGGSERIKEIDIEVARRQAQRQSLFSEKDAVSSKISLFNDEMNSIRTNLEQVDKESQENNLRISSFNSKIKELEAKISEDKVKIEEYTKDKGKLEEEELSLNKKMDEAKESMQRLEKEEQELRTSIYNKKLEIQSFEYEKEKIRDYIRQVYNIEFEPASQEIGEENINVFLAEKEKFQKRMKFLGEVNLVAIEEFEELKKREDFLENQKQDLVTSKENLKKAIAKINRTSKELFVETFTKIEQEFNKNFRFLFNGGKANLILIEPDNVLESGVEIEVQPPGKKLQNVSLLSGGEKALTAIALIFAIFRVKPSPLCLLDEIDAPLDEANVGRFNYLLKEFASFSQFILITHNKKTMSNADVLYGVTMEEKGISKLVSVKFVAETEGVSTA